MSLTLVALAGDVQRLNPMIWWRSHAISFCIFTSDLHKGLLYQRWWTYGFCCLRLRRTNCMSLCLFLWKNKNKGVSSCYWTQTVEKTLHVTIACRLILLPMLECPWAWKLKGRKQGLYSSSAVYPCGHARIFGDGRKQVEGGLSSVYGCLADVC
jgi:hypothetical protein